MQKLIKNYIIRLAKCIKHTNKIKTLSNTLINEVKIE